MRFFVPQNKGFTLVEIVVAVGIVGLLASVVIGNLTESRRESRDTLRVTHLEQIKLALRLYRDSEETYPDFDGGVVIGEGGAFDELIAPYLSGTIVDPLGSGSDTTYEYVYDSDYDDCTLPGVGANKKVLYAKSMERTSSSNWDTICGGTTPGTDTFGIILQ